VNQQFEGIRSRIKGETLGAYDAAQKAQQDAQKEMLDRYLKQKMFEQTTSEKGLDRALKERALEQSASDKNLKKQELNVTQSKMLGLAESGQLANKQYNQAVAEGYNPTSYSTLIDQTSWAPQFLKSDKGKKAAAAQSSWVESYLRDASGAAIAKSERDAYAKDFFPQPGDTPEIVANKAELRAQKEKNALVAAGVKGTNKFQEDTKRSPSAERKTYQGKTYEYIGGERNNPKSWKVVGQ
jgi:hypothetical protein